MSGNKQIAVQRAASLLPLAALLSEFGVSLKDVLAGTGVAADQLRPDAFLPFGDFIAILENASRLTGRDDIGILLGQRQTLKALGPLGIVMQHATTLGEALSAFTAFQINNSTGGAVYFMRAQDDIILGYGIYDSSVCVSHQLYDLVLSVGCNLIAELTCGALEPEEILVSRVAPTDLTPYQRLGRCPVRFGQIQTGLLLRVSTLGFRLPGADADRHERALANLLSAARGSPQDLSGHVRHLLRPLLLSGQGRMVDVARRLGLHPRVLRRRLQVEGTTFEALKDEVRFVVARELLMLETLSISDIAATLDYASASSFVHAFKRLSGSPPGQWRKFDRIAAG